MTNIGSTASFTWKLTAAHRTSTWEYFVDGRLFRTFDQRNTHPPYDFSHTLSGLPSGRHTIFVRWNIADTINAFYNCIDVNVGGARSACSGDGEDVICEEQATDGEAAGAGPGDTDEGGCSAAAGAASPWLALAVLAMRRRRRCLTP